MTGGDDSVHSAEDHYLDVESAAADQLGGSLRVLGAPGHAHSDVSSEEGTAITAVTDAHDEEDDVFDDSLPRQPRCSPMMGDTRSPSLQRQLSESCLATAREDQLPLTDDEQPTHKRVAYRLPLTSELPRHRFYSEGNLLDEQPSVQLRRKFHRQELPDQTSSLPCIADGRYGSGTPTRPSSVRLSSSGDKMVLQVVLPQSAVQSRPNSLPLSTDPYIITPRRPLSVTSSRQDLIPRSISRQSTETMFGGSVAHSDLPPTDPQEKITSFWSLLTVVLSSIYAVFIICVGIIIYIGDIFITLNPVPEAFNIFLVAAGFIYFIFLYLDILFYTKRENAKENLCAELTSEDFVECKESPEGDLHVSVPLPSKKLAKSLEDLSTQSTGIPHLYCFSQGRHSGSFYLKLGAAVFCFGHVTHYGLLVGYESMSLTSSDNSIYNCTNVSMLILDIIYPIYSFFQLFFIFKYSNVIINKFQLLARFTLMHCIATSICFWMWTILRETLLALGDYEKSTKRISQAKENESQQLPSLQFPETFTSYVYYGVMQIRHSFGVTYLINTKCGNDTDISIIYRSISPYLYPFSIEYSILIAGVLYIIWQNIGQCGTLTGSHCKLTMTPESSNVSIHVDCHSANKGLFAGIIVLLGAVVSTILFFVAVNNQEYVTVGVDVHMWAELTILILMTSAVIFAYWPVMSLDINKHPISLLDDLLLVICLPSFFMYALLSIYPSAIHNAFIYIVIILIQVLQVLLQTPFIIAGLRRCSNSRALRQKKPGREVVTFLIVCNIALWIMQTFEIKSGNTKDHRYEFYGKSVWTILGHLPIPLMMFYRFHSSVCLVDIWKSAYEPGE